MSSVIDLWDAKVTRTVTPVVERGQLLGQRARVEVKHLDFGTSVQCSLHESVEDARLAWLELEMRAHEEIEQRALKGLEPVQTKEIAAKLTALVGGLFE